MNSSQMLNVEKILHLMASIQVNVFLIIFKIFLLSFNNESTVHIFETKGWVFLRMKRKTFEEEKGLKYLQLNNYWLINDKIIAYMDGYFLVCLDSVL